VDRRSALVSLLSPALAALWRRAAAVAPEMRITRIDTVYWESRDDAPFWPHWTWLRLHTDKGLVGLGETYPRNPTEAASSTATSLAASWSRPLRRRGDLERALPAFDYQISGGTEMRVLLAVRPRLSGPPRPGPRRAPSTA
jgi:hypothetical protein